MRVGRDAAPPGVATQPRPGAALGAKPGGRTTRTPCGPRPVEGKLPRMPRGAPVGAIGESQMAPRNAPIGAPSPSIRGTEKEKDYGRIPAPAKELGPLSLCCLTTEYGNRRRVGKGAHHGALPLHRTAAAPCPRVD